MGEHVVQHPPSAPFFLELFQEPGRRLGHDPSQGVDFILSFFDPELLEGKERKTETRRVEGEGIASPIQFPGRRPEPQSPKLQNQPGPRPFP